MPFAVLLTDDAVHDLEALYDYLSEHDLPAKADHVLGQLEAVFASLAEQPHRGAMPNELQALGLKEFREVFFKPYRIIYRIDQQQVYVLLIADGRRDMQTLLQQRLLRV